MTFSYYKEPDLYNQETDKRNTAFLKADQDQAIKDLQTSLLNQKDSKIFTELGMFSKTLAETGTKLLSSHIENQTAQAHFDYHTGAYKNPGVLDATNQSINNASKFTNQVANDIEQEDGTGSIVAEEVRSRDPYYMAAYQRAEIQGRVGEASIALENAKESLTIIGEDGTPLAYGDITKPADMAAWQAAFTRQFIGNNFSNVTPEAFASLVDKPLKDVVAKHAAQWARENATKQKQQRLELSELDIANAVKGRDPTAIISTSMNHINTGRMLREEVSDSLKSLASSGDLPLDIIESLERIEFDHKGGGKTTLKDQLGQYWGDIRAAAKRRFDDIRASEQAQREADEQELIRFWEDTLNAEIEAKKLTKLYTF